LRFNKLDDILLTVEILALTGDNMLNHSPKLGVSITFFTMFTPDANDKGVFCHCYLPGWENRDIYNAMNYYGNDHQFTVTKLSPAYHGIHEIGLISKNGTNLA
jgi:hypothetical protein